MGGASGPLRYVIGQGVIPIAVSRGVGSNPTRPSSFLSTIHAIRAAVAMTVAAIDGPVDGHGAASTP
jgi:hypothetical protein